MREVVSFVLGAAALGILRLASALPAPCRARGEAVAEAVLGVSIVVSGSEP